MGLLWSRSGVDVCKLGSLLVDFCRSVSVDQVWSGVDLVGVDSVALL
jgi:hypothetical protein